jgi:predicted metal-dependent phosphoesterase TrpH
VTNGERNQRKTMDDRGPVDLHIHTVCSDGALTPQTLVGQALERGLAAVAVTDHDTVMGVEPTIEAARGTGLEVIPGVELSSRLGSEDIHVLGYFVHWTDPALLEALGLFQRKRYERALKMVERLQELGLDVSFDRVLRLAGEGTIGRPHVARALLEERLIGTFEEAFQRYIGYKGPAYVAKHRLEPADAIALIRQAGGVAALAHPGTLARDDLVPVFVSQGLDAIEVWHPMHTVGQLKRYWQCAREHGLIVTGGSDSHGERVGLPDSDASQVTYASVQALRSLANRRRHGRRARDAR